MIDRGRGRYGFRGEPGDEVELVVLLDESGRPCGSAPKAEVHHQCTPLHLAFSCWVTDSDGRVLITRRAWTKTTWPGVWTNAFCGHPRPGESMSAAVHRRARDELGASISEPRLVLPGFRYRAVMPDGVVENEICPVFTAELLDAPSPVPDEVAEFRWLSLHELRRRIDSDDLWFSPWATLQLADLAGAFPTLRPASRPTAPASASTRSSGTLYRDLLGHRRKSPSACPSPPV